MAGEFEIMMNCRLRIEKPNNVTTINIRRLGWTG
jgi:hypothetical protein